MFSLIQRAALALTLWGVASMATAQTLSLTVFNPGEKSLFPVTSTLVTGPTEAILIDAQFQRDDAQSVLALIKKSGKKLTTVYISHGDPDYYFGLDVIHAAYPDAKIVASPATVKKIRASIDGKVAYWGPILKENAPKKAVIPEVYASDTFSVDGEILQIVGLDGHDPSHTFVWIPSLKTVTGGVVVFDNLHVWMADNQTPASRQAWIKTLDNILALKPERIIPGHMVGNSAQNHTSVAFTREYIQRVEALLPETADAEALVAALKKDYPNFAGESDLSLSAKVLKGELKWPQ